VRLRLTALYGGLFLISGAGLLAITNALVRQATSGPLISQGSGFAIVVPKAAGTGPAPSVKPTPLVPTQLRQFIDQALRVQSTELHQLLIGSEIALCVMAVVSVALGWIMAGRVIRPLAVITAAVRRISATNLGERLALEGPKDELRELADTFDELLGRLQDSFLAQRWFAAYASHELRGPLARQRTLIQVALADPDASTESLRAVHERVLAAGARQEHVIDALLALAQAQSGVGKRDLIDLAGIAGEVLASRQAEAAQLGLQIRAALRPAPTLGDARLVEVLIANLVDNALRHNIPGGQVQIETGMRAGQAVVSVANTGAVVPAAAVDQLFQPFQRLAANRAGSHDEGIGLGLSIVWAIAQAYGSILTVHPRDEGGLHIESSFLPGGPGAGVQRLAWAC
jgi:signal transduction histidine kinase